MRTLALIGVFAIVGFIFWDAAKTSAQMEHFATNNTVTSSTSPASHATPQTS